MNDKIKRSGFAAIIGKPNVGKSTLMNHMLGKKISITSSKPQTTRQRLLGIKSTGEAQIIFVDTPGLQTHMPRELNRYMNRVAKAALHDVDVVLFLLEASSWDAKDNNVLKLLGSVTAPVILVINKIDLIKDKKTMLPLIDELQQKYNFHKILPISAKKSLHLDALEAAITELLPKGQALYSVDDFCAQSDEFIVAEFVREKLMRNLGQELPYGLTVTLEALEESDDIVKISALIWVDRLSHKSIVIGKQGEKLKQVSTLARHDIEMYYGKKVFLRCWVKVKSNWSDNADLMGRLGFDDKE